MKKTAQHVMMLFLLASACGASAGVFDDAKVWVRGAVDQNGDGLLKTTRSNADTSDLPNALKAGAASDPSNVWEVRGPAGRMRDRRRSSWMRWRWAVRGRSASRTIRTASSPMLPMRRRCASRGRPTRTGSTR